MKEMTANWDDPIFDRSPADLANRTPKAHLNAADWNRIEGNIDYLEQRLTSLRYRVRLAGEPVTDWGKQDILDMGDVRRICDNVKAITDAYFRPEDDMEGIKNPAYIAGGDRLGHADANHLEAYLFWIRHMIEEGTHHNKHGELERFEHGQLAEYDHETIRKGRIGNEEDGQG
jgi:hypothetical protein